MLVGMEPRWLSDEEQRTWRAIVRGSANLLDRLDRHLRARFGLSLAEYEILFRLSEAPQQRIRMADLAACVSHSRSRLSHTVTRLQRDELVARETCRDDGRGVFAVLTEHGLTRLRAAAREHVNEVRRVVFDVADTADLSATRRLFETLDASAGEPARQPT